MSYYIVYSAEASYHSTTKVTDRIPKVTLIHSLEIYQIWFQCSIQCCEQQRTGDMRLFRKINIFPILFDQWSGLAIGKSRNWVWEPPWQPSFSWPILQDLGTMSLRSFGSAPYCSDRIDYVLENRLWWWNIVQTIRPSGPHNCVIIFSENGQDQNDYIDVNIIRVKHASLGVLNSDGLLIRRVTSL